MDATEPDPRRGKIKFYPFTFCHACPAVHDGRTGKAIAAGWKNRHSRQGWGCPDCDKRIESARRSERMKRTHKHSGFAKLGKKARRRNASLAGKKAQDLGRAHRWTPEQAAALSKKGIEARWGKKSTE